MKLNKTVLLTYPTGLYAVRDLKAILKFNGRRFEWLDFKMETALELN